MLYDFSDIEEPRARQLVNEISNRGPVLVRAMATTIIQANMTANRRKIKIAPENRPEVHMAVEIIGSILELGYVHVMDAIVSMDPVTEIGNRSKAITNSIYPEWAYIPHSVTEYWLHRQVIAEFCVKLANICGERYQEIFHIADAEGLEMTEKLVYLRDLKNSTE